MIRLQLNNNVPVILIFFSLMLMFGLLFIFYGIDYHEKFMDPRFRVESFLFDVRTRIKPKNLIDDVLLVSIDEHDLEAMPYSSKDYMSARDLKTMMDLVLASDARAVITILNRQVSDYLSNDYGELFAKCEADSRVMFGIFDLHSWKPTTALFSDSLRQYSDCLHGSMTDRIYSQEVIRSLPLWVFRNDQLVPHLALAVARKFAPRESMMQLEKVAESKQKDFIRRLDTPDSFVFKREALPELFINFEPPEYHLQISALSLLAMSPKERRTYIRDKAVVIGLIGFQKRSPFNQESTYTNTPYTGESNMIRRETARPLTDIYISMIDNFINDRWLREPHVFWNIVQTISISFVCAIAWVLVGEWAVLITLLSFIALLWLSALAMQVSNLYIPMVDSCIGIFLASLFGAFYRSHYMGKMFHRESLRLKSQRQLTLVHSQLLGSFVGDMLTANRSVAAELSKIKLDSEDALAHDIYTRSLVSTEDLGEYLHDIRNFSQLTSQRSIKAKNEFIHLEGFLNRIISQFELRINEKSLDFDYSCPDDIYVYLDPLMFEPIFFNLISNAIKYTRDGSQVGCDVRIIKRCLYIRVKDKGPGIEEGLQERIFEKFYRIKRDDVYSVKGTGLGLYLSKYFADRLGIAIQVDSTFGEGSCFTLILPRKRFFKGANHA